MSQQGNADWFEVRTFDDGVVGIGEPGHFEDVKSFLVEGNDRALLIDTGMGLANIRDMVEQQTTKPVLMVNSHGHLDHIGDNWRFEHRWAHAGDLEIIRTGVPNEQMRQYLAPEAFSRTPPEFDRDTFSIPGTEIERAVDDGDLIDLGGRTFIVLHTPGHSAGSISLYEEETGILFAGDVIYEGRLYTHQEGGSARDYRSTLRRLKGMVSSLSVVYPAHKRYPLRPAFIEDVHDAMEAIWDGRVPDDTTQGHDRFQFQNFSFTFRSGFRE